MAKTVDITEKLSFDENPRLVIKGREIEVNADASTMLKLIGAYKDGGDLEAVLEMFQLLFNEEGRKAIEDLKLSFKDLQAVIEAATGLVMGEDESGGGVLTRTMT